MRMTEIPERVNSLLEEKWKALTHQQKLSIASKIQEISCHFQNPKGLETPWESSDHQQAYLFYFLPLNLARASSLMKTLQPLLKSPFESLYDIGSGLGNLEALKKEFPRLLHGDITSIEKNNVVPLFVSSRVLKSLPSEIPPGATAFYSYSWVEIKTPLSELKKFDHLIFIEPSTSLVARKLMALRKDLIREEYKVLAPCTHHQDCPLLIHSERDWCHDRVHFKKPLWFEELESLLPMKNHTLTYSYLVMSRSQKNPAFGCTRVIGDTLKEKGKTRQAICFDSERRFLSWLKREHKKPEVIDHGSLIQISNAQEKGSEIRVLKTTRIEAPLLRRKTETR